QAIGASVTVLLTNILMFVLGMRLVTSIVDYNKAKLLKMYGKVFIAAAAMGVISFVLKSYLNIFIVVAIGGVSYFALLFAVKAFTKEDILSVAASFKR
ncbi:hypothetical protein HGA64_02060, partial [Candidatus Falkowbacteria bacterium]|nr:hypothetical protein [Candidatus Falkowbacteria bacterium]